ncbi:MAG TPA: DUF3857 domain-containing protein [Chitinophagaceae bacterium]|nr:DUF3857 domain-containing protein [Chitinophagaceae bacterium]
MRKIKQACFVLSASLLLTVTHAQDTLPEFGKIDVANLKMAECEFDKDAEAMYLLNYENIDISLTNIGFYVTTSIRKRIKVLKQTGVKYATVTIPYYRGADDKIKNVEAITYNLDNQGNIITQKIDKKDIFKVSVDKDEKNIRFAMPGVKEGSVIEFAYTEKRAYIYHLPVVHFDDVIPTRTAVCDLSYPLRLKINSKVYCTAPLESASDTNRSTVSAQYKLVNLPSIRFEPFTSSYKDNIQRLELSIIPAWTNIRKTSPDNNWGALSQYLLSNYYFGNHFFAYVPEIEKLIDSIKGLYYENRISTVYNLVRDRIKWNNTYDMFTYPIDQVWKAGEGSSGDINFTILNLLRRTGVTCNPVIVSTRDNGTPDFQFASLSQFNNVDVLVKDSNKYYLLDGTEQYQSYSIPPFTVANSYGLIIDASQPQWLKIDYNNPSMRNVINIKVDIDSSGALHGSTSEFFYGYAKVNMLSGDNSDDEGSKDLLETGISNIKIDSVEDKNKEDDDKPLMRTFNFKAEMQQTGDYFFLNPLFLTSFRKNPFKDSVRHADIDFGCNQSYNINMYITLPQGIEVSELPPNKEIRLADTSFSYGRFAAKQGNAVVLRTHFDLQNASYAASQYPFVREVFNKMYAMFNEQLVFKYKR